MKILFFEEQMVQCDIIWIETQLKWICALRHESIAWGTASFEKCNEDYNELSPVWIGFDLTIYYTQGHSQICNSACCACALRTS